MQRILEGTHIDCLTNYKMSKTWVVGQFQFKTADNISASYGEMNRALREGGSGMKSKCGPATRRFSIAVTLVASCLAVAAASQHSQPTFPCYTVRARYAVYTADGVRELWPIGSRRKLWVEDGDDKLFGKLVPDHQNEALYGEFTVCPLEPGKPGAMRHVHIRSWKDLKYGPPR
jgi:hypothetical protein